MSAKLGNVKLTPVGSKVTTKTVVMTPQQGSKAVRMVDPGETFVISPPNRPNKTFPMKR